MSYLKSVLLLTVLFFFSINLSAQLANFDEGCIPLKVTFTPPAGASSFNWDFGNGASSTLQNPTQDYLTPGEFTVTFTDGATQVTEVIKVYPKTVASFQADTLFGCAPLGVNFTSTSTIDPNAVITSVNWAFGDGQRGTGADVNHIYDSGRSATVGLTILSSTEGCGAFIEVSDYISISPAPEIAIAASPTSACEPPLIVTYTNSSPRNTSDTYAWDFDNGDTSTDYGVGAITFDTPGAYNTTFTITDDIGCSSDTMILVNIGGPLIDVALPDTICASPIAYQIVNNSSAGRHIWTFSSPADPPISSREDPMVVFPEEGTYTITYELTDLRGGCTSEETFTVYAEMPDADFTIDPLYTCELPTEITYTSASTNVTNVAWTLLDRGNGAEINDIGVETVYSVPRDTSTYGLNGQRIIDATIKVVNQRGCEASLTKSDTIFAPNARFNVDTTMGCAPLEVTFYDSLSISAPSEEIINYTFIWGDGSMDSFTTNDSVTHTFAQAGEYDVVLLIENSAGCIDTSYAVPIHVGAPVVTDFTVDKTTICPGDTIEFTATGDTTLIDAWHFDTDGSRMSHCADQRTARWEFGTETGMMTTTLTALYNGCPTVVEKTDLITVNGPIAKLDYEINCDEPFNVNFTNESFDATTVTWEFGEGNPSMDDNPTHVYSEIGDFEVILIATNSSTGCPESRDTNMVHIRIIEASFELEDHYCLGQMIQFDATTSTDVNATCWKGYTWFPSDSRPITTQDSIIDYEWMNPDTQTVELIVEDINGCKDTLRDTTIVFAPEAIAEVDPGRLCVPNTVEFRQNSTGNAPIVRWEWQYNGTDTRDDPDFDFTYTEIPDNFLPMDRSDSVNVQFIAFDSLNCSDTLYWTLEFYEPVSEIFVDDPTICIGEELTFSASDFTEEGHFLTYEWSLNGTPLNNTTNNGTATAGDGDFNISFPDPNILRVDFVEDSTGCEGSTVAEIFYQDIPDAGFTSPIDGNVLNCPGEVDFVANSIGSQFTHEWDPGDGGAPISGLGSITYPYGRDTVTVSLTVETSFGCSNTSSKDYIFVAPQGEITATEVQICEGQQVTFDTTGTRDVDNFEFIINGMNLSDEAPFTYLFDEPGENIPVTLRLNLDLTGTDITCVVSDEIFINVDPLVQSGDSDTTFTMVKAPAEGAVLDPFALPALPSDIMATDVIWSTDPDLDITDPLQPVISNFNGERSKVYTAMVPIPSQMCATRVQTYVVNPVKIPNIFSPNGDEINDYFNIFLNDETADYPITVEDIVSFEVFNRWGQRVYNNETPDTGWDGMYNEQRQVSDAYIYRIVLQNPDGTIGDTCEGDVTLYR